MLTGKIVNLEHAPGFGTIQPDDGSEMLLFSVNQLREPAEPNVPVTFDTSKKMEGGGSEAINIRVVKASFQG